MMSTTKQIIETLKGYGDDDEFVSVVVVEEMSQLDADAARWRKIKRHLRINQYHSFWKIDGLPVFGDGCCDPSSIDAAIDSLKEGE